MDAPGNDGEKRGGESNSAYGILCLRYEFPPFYDASDETFTLVVFRFRRQLEEEKEREEKERCGPRVVVFSIVVIICRRPRTSSSSST